MNTRQKGFGVVEIILIIVVVGLIGFVGWYVWDTNTKTDQTLKDAEQGSQSQVADKKYLTITEWGVRVPYDEDVELKYELTDRSVSLTSKALLAIDPACTPGAAGSISRYAPTDESYGGPSPSGKTAEEAAKTDKDYVKVGDHYYRYAIAQYACSEAALDEISKTNDILKALMPKLEAIAQ